MRNPEPLVPVKPKEVEPKRIIKPRRDSPWDVPKPKVNPTPKA